MKEIFADGFCRIRVSRGVTSAAFGGIRFAAACRHTAAVCHQSLSALFAVRLGEEEPHALPSMPVRLLRRLTVTALRAPRRVAACAGGIPLLPRPSPLPQRAFPGERVGTRGESAPNDKRSAFSLFVLPAEFICESTSSAPKRNSPPSMQRGVSSSSKSLSVQVGAHCDMGQPATY